ncbi:MAG: alanine:cation symporter family protein, partial [Oscillospiraceae bacterium]|nr:alanine:cation symporter family protein [Oscillospiraceae bacterium]
MSVLQRVNDLLWGPGTLALLLGTGLFLNLRMRFLPWRRLGFALRSALGKEARRSGKDGVSPFSALMTTLAATIGTGNIVGVATALVAGGPGALLWMEISALLGMATMFAECMLSVKYRRRDAQGRWHGGPMYMMEAAFGRRAGRVAGCLFALFAAGASFGIGSMAQANAITDALGSTFGLPDFPVGLVLSLLSLLAILGGISSISRLTSVLVPVMSAIYLAAGLAVIFGNAENLLPGILSLFRCAFSPEAVAGGMAGAALRWGVARGVFSNEAGLGSSGIAAAAADTDDPVRQGYISMTGAFFDTVVICTVTGLAICCSGVLGATDTAGRPVDGAALTLLAFETVLGALGSRFLAVSIVLFAFSTILGWEYQGEQAFSYLFRRRGAAVYRLAYALSILLGATARLETVYLFSDACNALMCIPNLVCVL